METNQAMVTDNRVTSETEKKIVIMDSWEHFRKLEPKTKVHSIINGKIRHYIYVQENPVCHGYFLFLEGNSLTAAVCIKPDFSKPRTVWFTDYNCKEVGEIMIKHANELIENYKEIFFRD